MSSPQSDQSAASRQRTETIELCRQTHRRLRDELIAARDPQGHWVGRLSSSALSTATAVSALASADADRHDDLIRGGIAALAGLQNEDGGFGDTDRSKSNIATTYLVLAADTIASRRGDVTIGGDVVAAAEAYVERSGGLDGLRRRYGKDKTFVVPILTNLAIAGRLPWRDVPSLPFELAAVPSRFYAAVRMPVVSYAVPALVAIGQVKHHHAATRILPLRWLRTRLIDRTRKVLSAMQPQSGGYLEATPLTSFVLMSLASCGEAATPVAMRCQQFLVDSVRRDGQWPIDTNLATWVTSLAIEALTVGPQDDSGESVANGTPWLTPSLRQWHRRCQHRQTHPFTHSPPGGWGWTDLSGAVPDGDDTPAAMIATRRMDAMNSNDVDRIGRNDDQNGEQDSIAETHDLPKDEASPSASLRMADGWLRQLQNRDGGVPTFCRGWGRLPFDRSSVDLTAHAIRSGGVDVPAAVRFLVRRQFDDGHWSPLWFGNQDRDEEDNPIYGTSRVLMAAPVLPPDCVDAGVRYLLRQQNEDGGWGGGPSMRSIYGDDCVLSSVEETALALEALAVCQRRGSTEAAMHDVADVGPGDVSAGDISAGGVAGSIDSAIIRGSRWLCHAVSMRWHHHANPIGFYFAKLWYYEDLYPLIFATRALGTLVQSSMDEQTSSLSKTGTLPQSGTSKTP